MYARPLNLDETLRLAAEPEARILAGGTDIFPAAREGLLQGLFIDVTRLDALRGVSIADGEIRIGAATTWSDLVRAELPPAFDALKIAAREIGAVQIQNRATIAGNLCNASPAADGVPPLLALDADVELASLRGVRRMPLAAFLTGNRRTLLARDEVMTAIVAPMPATTARSTFLKLGARRYLVISIAMVAVLLDISDDKIDAAAVAVGACSAVAQRLPAIESRLIGAPARAGLGAAVRSEDLAAMAPIDDLRASAGYRRDAALTLVRRAVDACVLGQPGGVC
jgi:CO/xanthine dehydrogenase FAD-binding subunit